MKLINYVLQNDVDRENIRILSEHFNTTKEEYILNGYCPSSFDCIKNTPYKKPFKSHNKNKNDCQYRYEEDIEKCNECWNREVLVKEI